MLDLTPRAFDLNSLDERITWFRRVRWAATVGHGLVFAAAYFWLVPDLNLLTFLVVQMLLIVSNLALYRFAKAIRSGPVLGLVLVFDVLLLTALLYAYGGHTNPFSMVYLVHVVLAAVLVGQGWTWGVAILSTACFAALFGAGGLGTISSHHSAHSAHGTGGFDLHLQGMLAAFVLLSFLIAGFVSRMRLAIESQEREILRRGANEDRLAALTQLSAGAAHELGTPLATMSVVLEELIQQSGELSSQQLEQDLTCVKHQLNRCAAILQKMAPSSGDLHGEMPREFTLSALLESVSAALPEDARRSMEIRCHNRVLSVYLPFDAVSQAITSLLKNAFDATHNSGKVLLEVSLSEHAVGFTIIDRGIGMDESTLLRLGEPFFTTKEPGRGTGLGIFLCRLLVSRLEGALRIDSRPGVGTTVVMELPQRTSWRRAA